MESLVKMIESTISNITAKEGEIATDLSSLIAINNYCVKVFSLVKDKY